MYAEYALWVCTALSNNEGGGLSKDIEATVQTLPDLWFFHGGVCAFGSPPSKRRRIKNFTHGSTWTDWRSQTSVLSASEHP